MMARTLTTLHASCDHVLQIDDADTLADHLAALSQRDLLLLKEEELSKASGAFHPTRYQLYEHQYEKEMQRRCVEINCHVFCW